MKIAVISEVSARDKNPLIVKALENKGFSVVNAGMVEGEIKGNELTYIHTGLMAATLLNLGAVDFVVGGCGTGQGFLNSAMQYPLVFCGLVESPLDAWLFGVINGGNCISLALNKGFGWAGDINLDYIFEKLFSKEFAQGYPVPRQDSQKQSRDKLKSISLMTHKTMEEILSSLDKDTLKTVFTHQAFLDAVKGCTSNSKLKEYIEKIIKDFNE